MCLLLSAPFIPSLSQTLQNITSNSLVLCTKRCLSNTKHTLTVPTWTTKPFPSSTSMLGHLGRLAECSKELQAWASIVYGNRKIDELPKSSTSSVNTSTAQRPTPNRRGKMAYWQSQPMVANESLSPYTRPEQTQPGLVGGEENPIKHWILNKFPHFQVATGWFISLMYTRVSVPVWLRLKVLGCTKSCAFLKQRMYWKWKAIVARLSHFCVATSWLNLKTSFTILYSQRSLLF